MPVIPDVAGLPAWLFHALLFFARGKTRPAMPSESTGNAKQPNQKRTARLLRSGSHERARRRLVGPPPPRCESVGTPRLRHRGCHAGGVRPARGPAQGDGDGRPCCGVKPSGHHRGADGQARAMGDVGFWPDGTARLTVQTGQESAGRRRSRRFGVRPDRRDAGQPDSCRCSSCRPGRRLLRTQRPHRHGAADGGRRSADRGGPAPRAMEARRHGRPLHSGRGRRRGAEVADLASIYSAAQQLRLS